MGCRSPFLLPFFSVLSFLFFSVFGLTPNGLHGLLFLSLSCISSCLPLCPRIFATSVLLLTCPSCSRCLCSLALLLPLLSIPRVPASSLHSCPVHNKRHKTKTKKDRRFYLFARALYLRSAQCWTEIRNQPFNPFLSFLWQIKPESREALPPLFVYEVPRRHVHLLQSFLPPYPPCRCFFFCSSVWNPCSPPYPSGSSQVRPCSEFFR